MPSHRIPEDSCHFRVRMFKERMQALNITFFQYPPPLMNKTNTNTKNCITLSQPCVSYSCAAFLSGMPKGIIRNEPAVSMYSDQDGYNVILKGKIVKSHNNEKRS